MTKELERGIHDMCNLGETIARENMAQGMTNGILASIRSLMETMGLTIEQAMSALKVPDIEKQKYMDLLKRQ